MLSAFDLRGDPASRGAVGARLSSVLSSPLSSVRAGDWLYSPSSPRSWPRTPAR